MSESIPIPVPAPVPVPAPAARSRNIFFGGRGVGAGVGAPSTGTLSSSFPGAVKTIQLAQLQNKHSHQIERQDSTQAYINCNTGGIEPRESDGLVQAVCSAQTQTSSAEKGIVKWFNGRKKYGFITDLEDHTDYFVHTEDLKPQRTSAPMLYTGEYVEYTRAVTKDGRQKACNVSGINKGPLLCDHNNRQHVKVVETTTTVYSPY